MKKKILAILLALVTVLILASCEQKNSLVGVWDVVDSTSSTYDDWELELYEDGTAIYEYGTGRYVSTDNTLTLLNMGVMGTKDEFSYELKGDYLTLIDEDGDFIKLERVE